MRFGLTALLGCPTIRSSPKMEITHRTIARMWKGVSGYECYICKSGDEWMLTLERGGRVLKESKVESPGEAIRLSESLRRELLKSNHAA